MLKSVFLKSGLAVKLGRIRPKNIVETPTEIIRIAADGTVKRFARLAPRFSAEMATAQLPASTNWAAAGMPSLSRMYKNDVEGDCVIAGKLHQVGVWTGNELGAVALASDAEADSQYHQICGAGDNGCDIPTVLDWFRDKGLVLGGVKHKIDGYVAIDWTNQKLVQTAIAVFGGGISLGINLPNDWTCTNCTWDITTSQIVGGHDVPVIDYNATGVIIATWAGLVTITWRAFLSKKWIEEAYLELAPDWYTKGNVAPSGIDASGLRSDMMALGNGTVPPLPDPGPPPVPEPPTPPIPPTPPLPPTPPAPPHTFTIHVPAQSVYGGFGMKIGTVPAFNLTGNLQAEMAAGPQMTIPPWLLPLLAEACSGVAVHLPGIWGMLLPFLCKVIPPASPEHMRMGMAVTIPPWFWTVLKLACAEAHLLPAPYDQIAQGLCALLPPANAMAETLAATPCGCK